MNLRSLAELAQGVARRLAERGQTLALAEASTGGALAEVLTAPPGASGFFLGGVVAYSNAAKEAILGVPRQTLERHGAVSAETAAAMAQGAQRVFGSDFAVAITGILGPGGATPTKPVGLTFVALVGPAGVEVERHLFQGDRAQNRAASGGGGPSIVAQAPGVKPDGSCWAASRPGHPAGSCRRARPGRFK